MKKIKKVILFLLMIGIGLGSLKVTHAAERGAIQIKGSDTMVNLGQAWAEEFMRLHPEVSIAVNGGGSGTGIAAIIAGTTDVAQSSRDMTEEEIRKANAHGKPIQKFVVAYDGIAVVVHPSNPVSELTIDQLSDIFTGKMKNWKDVDGQDAAILALSRERNSGTHVYFLEEILRKGSAKGPEEFSSQALMMLSSQAIVQEVKSGKTAIGYVGLGYVSADLKVVKIARADAGPFFSPSIETIHSEEYPISRPLYFFTHGIPEGVLKNYIDFTVSPEGQEIVRVLDFVPLKNEG